jgi:NADH-quinone oxidoreductase subunit J
MIHAIAFYIFAATALVFALLVVAARSPVYSALSLIGCLFAVAGIFALNSAHLVAVLQAYIFALLTSVFIGMMQHEH